MYVLLGRFRRPRRIALRALQMDIYHSSIMAELEEEEEKNEEELDKCRNWLPILVILLVLVGIWARLSWAAFKGPQMQHREGPNSHLRQRFFFKSRTSSIQLKSKLEPMENLQADLIADSITDTYLVNIHIGTPSRKLSLHLDTGSNLIWTQCQPCPGCYQQTNPIFNPGQSSSYANISCGSKECSRAPHPRDPARPCSTHQDPCIYNTTYLDKCTSRGILATETVTLKSAGVSGRADDAEISIPGVTFSCGHGGIFFSADGILGLGQGSLSFPEQIGATKFAYCLEKMELDASSTTPSFVVHIIKWWLPPKRNLSFLILVEQSVNRLARKAGVAGLQVHYTPMVQNPRHSTQYYVGIVEVVVGDSAVPIRPNVFGIDHTEGSGGVILDTGATFTYLVTRAFYAVMEAFRKAIAYPTALQTDYPELELCFQAAAPLKELRDLPQFRIVFENGAVLSPRVSSLFMDLGRGVKCLTIADADSIGFQGSIIGHRMQQNSITVLDIGRQRIGFAPADCGALKESSIGDPWWFSNLA